MRKHTYDQLKTYNSSRDMRAHTHMQQPNTVWDKFLMELNCFISAMSLFMLTTFHRETIHLNHHSLLNFINFNKQLCFWNNICYLSFLFPSACSVHESSEYRCPRMSAHIFIEETNRARSVWFPPHDNRTVKVLCTICTSILWKESCLKCVERLSWHLNTGWTLCE